MSDSEDEYVYSDYEEGENSEGEGMDEAQSSSRAETEGAQSGDNLSSGFPVRKPGLGSCMDGEVRLLNVHDIIPPMQNQISQIADLVDLPAAGAAALLRYTGWSSEKLLDRFWGDSEGLLNEVGINHWRESAQKSTVGTKMLALPRKSCSSPVAANPQAAGNQVAEERRDDGFETDLVLGLPHGYSGVALPTASDRITCRICFRDVPPEEASAAPCSHFFCKACYQDYLVMKLGDGPSVVFAPCPEHKCPCLVPPELWLEALTESNEKGRAAAMSDDVDALFGMHRDRYSQMILQQFVCSSKQMRWCPHPGCTKIVMAGAGVSNVKCGPGGCGNAFCFRCGEEAHAPADCDELAKWVEKCQNESETANWILANTKRCPKCTTRIEKNQGCNHMSCSQCKYEFCWMCMGPWTDHGANTGGYYKCNKFDPATSNDDMDSATKAKRELDRYLHYYKRYQAHHLSQSYAQKQLKQTEKRMVELQESSAGSSWIDVQYLKNANEMVIECRRTLKFTYVFGYFLPLAGKGEPNEQKELFEDLQETLERFTEFLSELTEMPIERMVKADIINNTRVTERFLYNLLQGCEDGLDEIVSKDAGAADVSVAQKA